MSCSGRRPTSPPDPSAADAAALTPAEAPPELAELVGGRWLLPPPRPPAGPQDPWLCCAQDPAEAMAAAGRWPAVALPEPALTTAVERVFDGRNSGLLLHRCRRAVMRALAAGWQGGSHTVVLPGALAVVAGHGLLITGAAGTGKSEAVLGLIDRGHRLVADDAFTAVYSRGAGWRGSACERARGRLAVRGLGLLDVAAVFGSRALAEGTAIHLEVVLEPHLHLSAAGLLAGEWGSATLPGVPCLRLPAGPRRNLPLLLETALRHYRAQT